VFRFPKYSTLLAPGREHFVLPVFKGVARAAP
jgi:hypothetical protein